MSFSLNALFGFTVGIGVIIGWVRFKKTDPAFFPFLLLLTLGLANEVISLVVMYAGYNNALNYNLFSLAEAMLVTWQFNKWNLFVKYKQLFPLLLLLYVGFFITEWFFFGVNRLFNSYFIIGYSLLIVLMSMSMINRLLFSITGNLLREPVYLICMGFCIYFTYTVLVEAFWLYGLNRSSSFRLGVYGILSYINLFTNLLYAFALLWIPLKPHYIMR
jgi:hypothetical protein